MVYAKNYETVYILLLKLCRENCGLSVPDKVHTHTQNVFVCNFIAFRQISFDVGCLQQCRR